SRQDVVEAASGKSEHGLFCRHCMAERGHELRKRRTRETLGIDQYSVTVEDEEGRGPVEMIVRSHVCTISLIVAKIREEPNAGILRFRLGEGVNFGHDTLRCGREPIIDCLNHDMFCACYCGILQTGSRLGRPRLTRCARRGGDENYTGWRY